MDELLYEKLKKNEEKVKKFGPHLSGAVNAGINTVIYPFFQISTQLQLSSYTTPNYTGKSFNSKLQSFIFESHAANKPFRPPKFYNYTSVVIWNSLQGLTGYYKGFLYGTSSFYLSILSRSIATSVFYDTLNKFSYENKKIAGKF